MGRYRESLLAARSRDRIPVEERFSALVQTAPGHTQPPPKLVRGIFPGVKRPGCGVGHLPPPNAKD